jgi:arginase
VDSPQPGGLRAAELVEGLRAALTTGLPVGLQVTIFDPDLDSGGRIARELTDLLVDVFAR